ncbi:MAG: FKBP-type peptidyl-prolyl cis-trans isomerase [Bacteriovoracaceae bacterium]|jgi:FKBP-type peptidyl-prolyl cis-trans isomerase FkpA|nr:FKBP-type peptidyl-prolyl cis-trans isomerase [Bacteriovoracaceae bacterium]
MKKLMLLVLVFVVSCNQTATKPENIKLKSEEDKTFYAMGFMLGANLARLDLNDQEISSLYKGLVSSAKGKKAEVELQTYQPKIQQMFKKRMEKIAEGQKSKGKKFIEDFLKNNKDAVKTKSGLVYKILKKGSNVKPTEAQTVEVHYHGTLINGEVFDSSVDRGKTISFPLNRVIKGWTEGVQLIGEGGKIKLVIPPELGYGEAGAPPKIPGGATLVFEVELFKVIKEQKNPAKKKK